ncbi:MAG: hypothetical protein RJA70_1759 [Pseudomonadota bacterium]|jgi:ubiquinone biosynthesis protein
MVSIVHAARDLGRLRDISRVLARYGFGEVIARLGLGRRSDPPGSEDAPRVNASAAVRIRLVLEELGPSFVKLGQIASTRADVLPPELIVELRKLQDAVPPVPFREVQQRLEESLGIDYRELFVSVDEEALAAGSIAQVHRAVLRTSEGEREVVLKVQRPGINATIASDLDLLHSLAALLERTVAETRPYSPVALVQQFDRAITNELDFTIEAENAARFAQNFENRDEVRFPTVFRQASSKHVICLEYLDGAKIDVAVSAGHDGTRLAKLAMGIIIKQIFEDGFFHADPHPGNVLILGEPERPVYALIDLGMIGRLSPRMRDLTIDLMVAAIRRDYDSLADAMYAISRPTKKVDMPRFRGEVALLAERYLGKQLKDVELSALIRDLVSNTKRFEMEVPPDFLLVGKALMTIEGIGKEIAPNMDIVEEARPFFFEILRKRYSPERLGSEALRQLERWGGVTSSLPDQLQEVLEDVRMGRATIQIGAPQLRSAAEQLGTRLFTALIISALILATAVLLSSGLVWPALATTALAVLGGGIHALTEVWNRFFRRK